MLNEDVNAKFSNHQYQDRGIATPTPPRQIQFIPPLPVKLFWDSPIAGSCNLRKLRDVFDPEIGGIL